MTFPNTNFENTAWSDFSSIVQEHSPFKVQPQKTYNFTDDLAIDSQSFIALLSELQKKFHIIIKTEEIDHIYKSEVNYLFKKIVVEKSK